MAEVISVRFKEVGKNYYFDPRQIDFKRGDKVIVAQHQFTDRITVFLVLKNYMLDGSLNFRKTVLVYCVIVHL